MKTKTVVNGHELVCACHRKSLQIYEPIDSFFKKWICSITGKEITSLYYKLVI